MALEERHACIFRSGFLMDARVTKRAFREQRPQLNKCGNMICLFRPLYIQIRLFTLIGQIKNSVTRSSLQHGF